MRSREDNDACLQNPLEIVPAILSKVHWPLRRADALGHSQLPASKPPSADSAPYAPHTQPVKGEGNDQISAVLGAYVSLQVTALNEVGTKHCYFHLLQPRYYYCPAGFLHESPREKLEDRFS